MYCMYVMSMGVFVLISFLIYISERVAVYHQSWLSLYLICH